MRLTSDAVLLVAAALVVAACGGGGSSDDGAAPGPPQRLAEAVTRLAEANTGHFASTTAAFDGTARSAVEGDYRLTPPAARVTVARRDPPDDPHVTEVLAVGRDAWSRDAGSGPGGSACYVHYGVNELFANGLLVRRGDVYAPGPVAVAGLGSGVYATDDDQVSGTSDLATVLSVADLSLPGRLGLGAGHPVPTTFTVDDDELLGWKVYLRVAVERARELPPTGSAGTGPLGVLAAWRGAITTELTRLGRPVDVVPPPAGRVVEYVDDPAELARRMAACGRQAP